jgi:hypothetical protein
MFLPGGDVNNWTRTFNETIKTRTKYYAPRNKRPRWAHYGAPLKQTFRTTEIETRRVRAGMRLYAAVGSSAPYAAYVDQGTGVHNGGSAYEGKILPPYTVGSASLYEARWIPPGHGRPLGPVMIRGQRGQEFFDKGLRSAFRIMVRQGQNIPGAPSKMSQALRTWPRSLENFSGGTPVTGRFIAQLNVWREWRDEAFSRGDPLGRDGNDSGREYAAKTRKNARRARSDAKESARRKQAIGQTYVENVRRRNKAKSTEKEQPKPTQSRSTSMAAQKKAFLTTVKNKFGAQNVLLDTYKTDGTFMFVTITFPGGTAVKKRRIK